MSATTLNLPRPVHRETLLLADDNYDPDEPPFYVAANVWEDRHFWVHYTVERYYQRLGSADPATWPDQYEHGQQIIGDLAEVMFGTGASTDPHCRKAAWDTSWS